MSRRGSPTLLALPMLGLLVGRWSVRSDDSSHGLGGLRKLQGLPKERAQPYLMLRCEPFLFGLCINESPRSLVFHLFKELRVNYFDRFDVLRANRAIFDAVIK